MTDHPGPPSTVASPSCGRGALVDNITRFLAHEHALHLDAIRACVERAIDDAGPEAVDDLGRRLVGAGTDWAYYPRDPLARRIHHVLAGLVLQQEPLVTGTEHLERVVDKPLVIVANHLSYSDANVVDVLLERAGRDDLAARLTVVAGPKVYSDIRRRFSSLCFATIKVPQSSARSSDDAVMAPREVARAAHRVIEIARERLHAGDALLVFPEGTRSRSGEMTPFLPGVARYLDLHEPWILPMGITGTERLFPVGVDALSSGPISLRIGRPVPARALTDRARGNRRLVMDCLGFAVADRLPPGYRGVYATDRAHHEAASQLYRRVFASG
jgi:1-acyl-sn-glycerol-3-phosphate acyltransferase